MSLASEVKVTTSDRRAAAETKARIEEKMRRLREVAPSVLDLSVREPTLPAPYGHTLEDKKQLFRLAREFGFQDIAVSTFADYPTVDVQFIRHLREQHADMNGLFSFCSPVQTEEGRPFKPNYGMERIAECSIPNVIFDLEIRPRTLARLGRSYETCLRDIEMSIAYMRQSLPEETLRRGRIYPNLADLFDAFEEDSEVVVRVLKLLEALPISAVIFEDVRGICFPFQTAELVKLIRRYTPPPRKILVHPHSGNGLENATIIEAILAGADGTWAAFTPDGAQIGQGSSLTLLTNLLRAGNSHLRQVYRFDTLTETAQRMTRIHTGGDIDANAPVVGENAYRYIHPYFEQTDQLCDLPPEAVGRRAEYRITPGCAPSYIVGKRLTELGYPREIAEDGRIIDTIRHLMNEAMMDGKRILFDDPAEIGKLVDTAQRRVRATAGSAPE